jgi:hypothetical protein
MLKHLETTNALRKTESKTEYSRILSAAVINSSFRKMLLSDPLKAVSGGYSGEEFHLQHDEKDRLASIHATSLAEFAAQLSQI